MIAWLLAAAVGPAWHIDRCPELDAEVLIELTAIDLGELADGTGFEIRCDDEAFTLRVSRQSQPALERVIPRAEIGAGAPERYLALELAELFEGSRYQRPEPPPDETTSPTPPPATPATPRRWGLLAASGRFEAGGAPVVPAGGGSLGLYARVWDHLSLRADVSGLAGARQVEDGRVRWTTVWGSGALLATIDSKRTTVLAGLGARVGGGWFRGLPAPAGLSGRTHGGLTWSPLVSFGLVAPRQTRLAVVASVDAGWTVRPIRGFSGADRVVSSGGPWVNVSLGLGVRFGR